MKRHNIRVNKSLAECSCGWTIKALKGQSEITLQLEGIKHITKYKSLTKEETAKYLQGIKDALTEALGMTEILLRSHND